MAKDTTYSSDPLINVLVATGKPYSLCTGEGDTIIPWKVVKDQAERYWDCYKRMKEDPNCKKWVTEPRNRYKAKRFENFEWRRLEKCGHLPFIDDADMFTEHLTQFIDDGERSSRPVQVKQHSVVHHQSYVSPMHESATKVIHTSGTKVISQAPRVTHQSNVQYSSPHQGNVVRHVSHASQQGPSQSYTNVLGAGNHKSMAVQNQTHSYQPYRMSHSQTPAHTVVRSQAYNPYTSPLAGSGHDVRTQSYTSPHVVTKH